MERASSYEAPCAAFRWEVPARYNIGHAVCRRHATDRTRFALYYEDDRGATAAYTFWDIRQRANRLSNALGALGVGRGDRVAIVMPQCPETAIAHLAVYHMGAVTVSLSILFGPDALQYRIADAGVRVALVDDATLGSLLAVRAECPGLEHVIGAGPARGPACSPGRSCWRR